VYDHLIEDMIKSQEQRIDGLVKSSTDYIEENTKDWMKEGKEFVVKTLNHTIYPLIMDQVKKIMFGIPQNVQPPLDSNKEDKQ
jgi:hypothetical protein